MSSDRSSPRFSFLDLPRALWFFLGPERWTFLFFSGVLLTVFCYVLVPPYIVGLIANFLIDYVRVPSTDRPPLSPLFWLVALLSMSYALVALDQTIEQADDGAHQSECAVPGKGLGI